MSTFRNGRRLNPNDIVEEGDEGRCTHPGCEVVTSHVVPHPNGFAGYLTIQDTPEAGQDMHYRERCKTHAERPDGQLGLFEEAS